MNDPSTTTLPTAGRTLPGNRGRLGAFASGQKAKRGSIGKTRRFRIFKRDEFKCRYCGKNSETVILEVDHIIPVAKGGTSDDENLITSCFDCNRGKRDTPLDSPGPTEGDRLRIAQTHRETLAAAELARDAAAARATFKQDICNFWCQANQTSSMDGAVLNVMVAFAKEHGVEIVFEWIQKAAERIPDGDDDNRGRYVSGIRRRMIEGGEL